MTVGQPQSNTQSPGTTIPDQNLGGTDVKDEMPMSREKKTVKVYLYKFHNSRDCLIKNYETYYRSGRLRVLTSFEQFHLC